jgi:circadian clock protein KaiC
MTEIPRTPTGVDGLDAMIGGGIPSGRVLLVIGGPGTGKTTLAIQYLVNGVQKYSENGIFVSLDAPRHKIFEEAKSHGWNFEKLCNEKKIVFIDGSPFTRLSYRATGFKVPERSYTVQVRELCDEIRDAAKSINSRRIAVDTLAALTVQFPEIVQRREVILELFEAVSRDGSTAIITDETRQTEGKTTMLEEYLADGLIVLRSSQVERTQVRMIEVEKIKASAIDDQIRPYILNKDGFSVLSDKDIFTYAAGFLLKK